ncbi:MAG: type II glyceraldehyde-3-phosphate dehydrogenase [Candidatus Methanoplasma sp.]|jgi:glyceraldehyde-3-phosphate dehydrogenase (NAD(P))|nr:type II glyceraldehyde-3-phosphate dehydrogenase [Candidatus Methanoplasma sp.]
MSKAKVGVNGYGTIGKRVAAAVSKQEDMEVVGVTKTKPNFEARSAADRGFDIYVPEESLRAFEDADIPVKGTIRELCGAAEIIVDCTPGGIGRKYKAEYESAGIKAIFQGGEDHSLTGISFNSTANYSESWGAQFSRVVSCNTTGLLRTLSPIDRKIKIKAVYATLIRRATDPGDSKSGPVNGLEPTVKLPTHHGPDVKSVMPWLNINTMAVKASTTLMHLHTVAVEMEKESGTEDILEIMRSSPRVRLINSKSGLKGTAEIMEFGKDLGRDRSDMYEIVVWEDGVKAVGNMLYYYQAIHQESDVVPENVDCIRSMCKLEEDAHTSVSKTNRSLGIN